MSEANAAFQEIWTPRRNFIMVCDISCLWNPDMQPETKRLVLIHPFGYMPAPAWSLQPHKLRDHCPVQWLLPSPFQTSPNFNVSIASLQNLQIPESNSGKWCPSLILCSFMALDGIDNGLLAWDSIELFLWRHCPSFFLGCHSSMVCESVLW